VVDIQSVDLASRYSAVVRYRGPGQPVTEQHSSLFLPEYEFLEFCCAPWAPESQEEPPEVLIVEDVPHGIPNAAMTKRVFRLQGMILELMRCHGYRSSVIFYPPALWQRQIPGVWRQGPAAVVPVAKGRGYEPPDLTEEGLSKTQQDIRLKCMTDYCAAYLQAEAAHEFFQARGTYDVKSSSRYAAYEVK
jgi:hypothetical protein